MSKPNWSKWSRLVFLVATLCFLPACQYLPELLDSNPDQASMTLEPNEEGDFKAPSQVPDQAGEDVLVINDNIPYFSDQDITSLDPYHSNEDLDDLDRVGEANALIGLESLPSEARGEIGQFEPTGWDQARYANIGAGGWLYNRSHLIGYQLTGVDDFENLMTGTRWFNEAMADFENFVAFYIEEEDNHVRYRATPIFEEDNLLASGAYMEAFSIEDNGQGVMFNVYIPNIQEGVTIDYADGSSLGPAGPSQEGDLPNLNPSQEEAREDHSEPCPVKGNINSQGEKIYHTPDGRYYDQVDIDPASGEECFQNEAEAQEAGWRASKQ